MFLVVMLPPAITLIWLGSQLLEQDRILEARTEIESREAAAEAIARSLGQSLNEAENWLPSGPQELPPQNRDPGQVMSA
jgi:hypothetical protein